MRVRLGLRSCPCCLVNFFFISSPRDTWPKVAALLSDMVPRDGGASPGGSARARGHPGAGGGGGESIRNGADPMEQARFCSCDVILGCCFWICREKQAESPKMSRTARDFGVRKAYCRLCSHWHSALVERACSRSWLFAHART